MHPTKKENPKFRIQKILKIGKRREFGKTPMTGLKINKEDKPLIESIERKK